MVERLLGALVVLELAGEHGVEAFGPDHLDVVGFYVWHAFRI
jgi:hypothetical protein